MTLNIYLKQIGTENADTVCMTKLIKPDQTGFISGKQHDNNIKSYIMIPMIKIIPSLP